MNQRTEKRSDHPPSHRSKVTGISQTPAAGFQLSPGRVLQAPVGKGIIAGFGLIQEEDPGGTWRHRARNTTLQKRSPTFSTNEIKNILKEHLWTRRLQLPCFLQCRLNELQ